MPRVQDTIPLIEAESLSKEYPGVLALDRISFTGNECEIIGVIGHNGAGKTTLLKILAGLVTPTSGNLQVQGIDVRADTRRLKAMMGYLPEESRLYETMRADAYLSFFGEIYGLDARQIQERSDALFTALALQPDGKKLAEFSKGMKRKVAIARSLLHDPALLIYDEPTSGLDPMTSRFIISYLRKLPGEGKTIVLSAHNLHQVEAICDRVMILRRGQIVAMGSMHELRKQFGKTTYSIWFTAENPGNIRDIPLSTIEGGYAVVRVDSVEAMNAATTAIASSGGSIERVESHFPSLEEMLVRIGQ